MDEIPPIPALVQYFSTLQDRQQWTNDLFDRTAPHYDRICRMMSAGTDTKYRLEALVRCGIATGQRILDVGTGTGRLARAAIGVSGDARHVVGCDISLAMLHQADAANHNPLVQAPAESLPFLDAAFDVVMIGYALRHVADLNTLFSTCLRVLRPGGRLIALEIVKPASRTGQTVTRAYFWRVVPFFSRLITGTRDAQVLMKYYWDTVENCVPPSTIIHALRHAGFISVACHVEYSIFGEYIAVKPADMQ